MPRIKTILCSGICLLYITAITAQVPPPKNKTISNVVGYQVYQQKLWSMKQLPKNSVLYQYNSKYIFHHDILPSASLRLLQKNISITDRSLVKHLSISEKLQSHLQANLAKHYQYYFQWQESCVSLKTSTTFKYLFRDLDLSEDFFIHQ